MQRSVRARFVAVFGGLALTASLAISAEQQSAAPTGPLAPEKYKDIQVLKDVPADQLDTLMRYFVASTGLQCQSCHMRDQATGKFIYEADSRNKNTARAMVKLVQTVNAGGQEQFGARINCATCHQGRNSPAGLQPAAMMTPEQIAAFNAQAARQGGPDGGEGRGEGPGRGTPPPPGAAGQPGQPGQAGRGNQTPPPAIDDVVNKYIEAIGGRAALEKLQSRVIVGRYVNRANQTVPFTIEEKGTKFRETAEIPNRTTTAAFDGRAGWLQTGALIEDIEGFPLAQATRLNDLQRALTFKDKYQELQAGRPTRLTLTPGGTPVTANLIQGVPAPNVRERFYFDATSGLLVRRQVITIAPLNGSLVETFDYSDYEAVNGVMMPFTIKRNNWATLDVLTVTDIKVNTNIDDARFSKPKG
jgi:DNA-directed RNA polymerase subunit M/transcription elongation factor TFIIS